MNSHPFLPAIPRRLVLASQSPRRRLLLENQGLEFEVRPARVVETAREGEAPTAYAERLAVEKSEAIATADREALVLGSDTIVVIEGEVLGKPVDDREAAAMLRRLADRQHDVITAVALCCVAVGFSRVISECTRVHFRALSDDEIGEYVRGGEPRDKAGAYGIQAQGALLVDRIEGCYFNVMGLPLQRLRQLLWEFAAQGESRA